MLFRCAVGLLTAVGRDYDGPVQDRVGEAGSAQVDAADVGPSQVGAPQVGPDQVCPLQIGVR